MYSCSLKKRSDKYYPLSSNMPPKKAIPMQPIACNSTQLETGFLKLDYNPASPSCCRKEDSLLPSVLLPDVKGLTASTWSGPEPKCKTSWYDQDPNIILYGWCVHLHLCSIHISDYERLYVCSTSALWCHRIPTHV
jgi:hypothetical protein